jgi:hypothetical protein
VKNTSYELSLYAIFFQLSGTTYQYMNWFLKLPENRLAAQAEAFSPV